MSQDRVNGRFARGQRRYSQSSLDPHEDPVSGLERVESAASLIRRRRQDYITDRQPVNRLSKEDVKAHVLSEGYESLDYEIIENSLYKKQESDPHHQVTSFASSSVNVLYGDGLLIARQVLISILKIFNCNSARFSSFDLLSHALNFRSGKMCSYCSIE